MCRIELEKSCTTETKTFTKITGFEKGDCKEIEVCKYGHGECIFSFFCINPHLTEVSESLIRRRGGPNGPPEEINYVGYIFAF